MTARASRRRTQRRQRYSLPDRRRAEKFTALGQAQNKRLRRRAQEFGALLDPWVQRINEPPCRAVGDALRAVVTGAMAHGTWQAAPVVHAWEQAQRFMLEDQRRLSERGSDPARLAPALKIGVQWLKQIVQEIPDAALASLRSCPGCGRLTVDRSVGRVKRWCTKRCRRKPPPAPVVPSQGPPPSVEPLIRMR
jgi:hypothetical protein